jgi:transcriptional regulator
MHPAPQFRWDDRGAMRALVADMGFGTLFVQTPDGPRVAHVPAIFTGQDSIAFHLANANLAARALDGANAVFVVTGPDAYISPDWYGLADQVPTWNYLAVELEGRVDAMPPAELPALIDALSADREARLAPKPPWTRDKMTPGLFDRMLGAITGYTLAVSAWRGTHKMGQNKPAYARLAVADALGSDPVAALMREAAL